MGNSLVVEAMEVNQISQVARIHRDCFPLDGEGYEASVLWISSRFKGYPANRYFVAKDSENVIGYVLWAEMGGFRKDCVLSFEQLGVRSGMRGKGVGARLIRDSLKSIKRDLQSQGRKIKLVMITTGESNESQRLFKSTLGAKVVAKIADFFEGDEVFMVAREKDPERLFSVF